MIDGVVRAGSPKPEAFMVCLPSVAFDGIEVHDQPARVQRPVQSGAFSDPKFGGILGSDLLWQFKVTFDLGHDRLRLVKDINYRADPYRFVTIGIQFAKTTYGFDVMSVWRNSPAEQAGNIPGDIITGIDGIAASALTADQFSSAIHKRAGTPILLTIGAGSLKP